MKFSLPHTIEILERTPEALGKLLEGISEEWAMRNEGPDTFSAYDVMGASDSRRTKGLDGADGDHPVGQSGQDV